MFFDVSKFILEWGYYGLFLGAMVEGETIVMTIASMCYSGSFNIFYVTFLAFLGTLIADQLSFYVGRFFGKKLFKRYESLEERSRRIFSLIEKYDTPFILGFRFIWGIRVLSPFVIGASKVPGSKFAFLNFIAALIWSFVICGAGYFIGAVGSTLFGSSSMFLVWIFNTAITASIIAIAHRLSKDLKF